MVHFGKEPDANDAGCSMRVFFLWLKALIMA